MGREKSAHSRREEGGPERMSGFGSMASESKCAPARMDKTGLIRRVCRKRLQVRSLSSRRVDLSSTITGNLSHVVKTIGNVVEHTSGHVDPLP